MDTCRAVTEVFQASLSDLQHKYCKSEEASNSVHLILQKRRQECMSITRKNKLHITFLSFVDVPSQQINDEYKIPE